MIKKTLFISTFMEKLIIKLQDINTWLDRVIDKVPRVIAPIKYGKKAEFGLIKNATDVDYDSQTTISSTKAAAFPSTETLFAYSKNGPDTKLYDVAEENFVDTVIWRARPCDAAAFKPMTKIFNSDYQDELYNKRYEKITLITFACNKADEFCFCTSVGGGPGSTENSDAMVTVIDNEKALIEVFTEKGQQLVDLAKELFQKADDRVDKDAVLAKIPQKFTKEEIHDKIRHAFNSPVWKAQSERCLGCGACAYVCPVCTCFDIQEDPHGNQGRRVRCWDSCGFQMYSQHTSGYNPRPNQAARWRQRILHKFLYMPDRLNIYGCTGCGRCSRACPVDMNIVEHLTSIVNSIHE